MKMGDFRVSFAGCAEVLEDREQITKKSRVAFAVRTEKPSSELCQLPKWGNNRLGRDRGEKQEFCVAIPSLR